MAQSDPYGCLLHSGDRHGGHGRDRCLDFAGPAGNTSPVQGVWDLPAAEAAGKTGKPINVKKGQFVAPEVMKTVVEKIESTGNKSIWLCERGYAFGYGNLIIDYRNFPIMKDFGKPVIFDATHSVQRPGTNSTSGDRKFIPSLACAAVVQKIAGLFMEVHENPEQALSDGPNSIRLSQLEDFIKYLIELDQWVKSKNFPELS